MCACIFPCVLFCTDPRPSLAPRLVVDAREELGHAPKGFTRVRRRDGDQGLDNELDHARVRVAHAADELLDRRVPGEWHGGDGPFLEIRGRGTRNRQHKHRASGDQLSSDSLWHYSK